MVISLVDHAADDDGLVVDGEGLGGIPAFLPVWVDRCPTE